jgi:hypothetical protein
MAPEGNTNAQPRRLAAPESRQCVQRALSTTRGKEERARKLVEMLKNTGENHGLLVVRGYVVIRNGATGLRKLAPDFENALAVTVGASPRA